MPTPGKPARIWTTAATAGNSVADERNAVSGHSGGGTPHYANPRRRRNRKSTEERIPPLPLVTGKPFDFAVERETLRKLYAMGDFSDIHVATVNRGRRVERGFHRQTQLLQQRDPYRGLAGASQRSGRPGGSAAQSGRTFSRKLACAKPSAAWKTLCTAKDLYLAKVTYCARAA